MKQKASGWVEKVGRGYIGNEEKKAGKNSMGPSSMHVHSGIAQPLLAARGLNTVRITGRSCEFANNEMGNALHIFYDGS